MKPNAHPLTIARRILPWLLVNFLLMPLACALLFIGYGKDVAKDFWKDLYGE